MEKALDGHGRRYPNTTKEKKPEEQTFSPNWAKYDYKFRVYCNNFQECWGPGWWPKCKNLRYIQDVANESDLNISLIIYFSRILTTQIVSIYGIDNLL